MNPIFIAHLIADFLLQPTWLVKWKERRLTGIALHSLIHAAVLLALTASKNITSLCVILLIALSHGVIDRVKIRMPKRSFEHTFVLDQIVHAVILLLALRFLPFNLIFWNSLNGILTLSIFTFFSFGIGIWNLMHIKSYPAYNFAQRTTRIFAVTLIFLAFITLSILG